jgi:transposase
MKKDIISMSTKEIKRLFLVKKAEEKLITQKEAANILDLSERQFRRILSNFRSEGAKGITHKLRNKPSPRKFEPHFSEKITKIYKKEFLGYKPTFFTQKLAEEYNISISKESTRSMLIQHELWTPKKKKRKHRTKRQRKNHCGELVQLDGSVHQWFPGKDGYCVLMLYIDDATSRVFARFYPYEGTIPAMDSFRRYVSRYGIPIALYADCHGTYKNNNKKLSIEEQLAGLRADTQFSRALNELSVSIIPAYSPQAKGRVERAFQTFQDRLCKELHRHKISSLKDANNFLKMFLKDHNNRFSVKPAQSVDLHRPALPHHALKKILCIQTPRSIDNDFTIRHDSHIFQLKQSTIAKKASVEDHTDGSTLIRINGKTIPFADVTYKFKQNKKASIPFVRIDPVSLKEIAS